MPGPLIAIEHRLAQATPGPWRWENCGDPSCDCSWLDSEKKRILFLSADIDDKHATKSDRDLIAHAPTDLAYLLARLKAAEDALWVIQDVVHRDLRGREPFRQARKDITLTLTTWQQAKGKNE